MEQQQKQATCLARNPEALSMVPGQARCLDLRSKQVKVSDRWKYNLAVVILTCLGWESILLISSHSLDPRESKATSIVRFNETHHSLSTGTAAFYR
jgi:hypothetical protein